MRHPFARAAFFVLVSSTMAAACGTSKSSSSGSASSSAGSGGGTSSAGSGGPGGGTSGAGGAPDWGNYNPKEMVSPYIVVDQFGYRTGDEKIAVLRDPEVGFDQNQQYTPSAAYAVINAATSAEVMPLAAAPWNGGATDASSGDKAYWIDFSKLTTPGDYYILDKDHGVRSFVFRVSDIVYRDVIKQAIRMLYYQRSGLEKKAQFAGDGWVDSASHAGPLQDAACRLYSAKNDANTKKDLHGGWYDAGDFNKYTPWTARYVTTLLHAYAESPSAFGDDYNIPESGNGIPDVIDETKWGMDWLLRMQNGDGSVLSIVGVDGGSPPSLAMKQSLYGSASTNATLSAAFAFAYGSKVFRAMSKPELTMYADTLQDRAKKAWAWAEANPNVLFYNNDGAHGTSGLGAGQQETDDYGRLTRKLEAAVYLFEVTGDATYKQFVDANYAQIHLIQWTYASPFEAEGQEALLYYTSLPGATPSVADKIKSTFASAMGGADNLKAFYGNADPYLAYIKDYTWGSNATKSSQGNMFYDLITFGVSGAPAADAERAAARYVHYIHGVNPLSLVYLSNMYQHGAESSANEFFHTWFCDGSKLWDRAGASMYGPPPGFLTGGPNPSYDWDGCCPNNCAGLSCVGEPISPPKGQPPQKSYKDFNTSWPLNSWSVTEPSNGYQVAYIRLLSKFVK